MSDGRVEHGGLRVWMARSGLVGSRSERAQALCGSISFGRHGSERRLFDLKELQRRRSKNSTVGGARPEVAAQRIGGELNWFEAGRGLHRSRFFRFSVRNREFASALLLSKNSKFLVVTSGSDSLRRSDSDLFHGRGDSYVDSIGAYLTPVRPICVRITDLEHPHIVTPYNVVNRIPRTPGPWGGDDGRVFDDGVFAEIKQVHVHLCGDRGVVSAVQFEYVKRNGNSSWSAKHGAGTADFVKKIEIDCANEFFIGIEGFYGLLGGSGGANVITSLTFHTNRGKYGPLGSEIGKYFTSIPCNGKVVGFFGKSGSHLNAIGVHKEYL